MSAVSLVFREGARPDVATVRSLASAGDEFSISFEPQATDGADERIGREGAGWVELLASGLTFDLTGLAPAPSAPLPRCRNTLGLDLPDDLPFEAITLRPGPHLSGGGAMLPVVRTLAWLGAVLSDTDGVEAICWHPAACWSAPIHYRESVRRWAQGGVFPGLILASLIAAPDGGLQSEGLAVFTGQELRLEPEIVGDRAAAAKLALRLFDFLVVQGRLTLPDRILGPDGHRLRLEPSANGLFVRVWRG